MLIEDAELIARVLARDDRYAFSQIVQKYQSQIRLFLRRMLKGNIEIAEELAQETFILAYRKLHTYNGSASFSSWLYTIAKNQFLQHLRRSKNSFSWNDSDELIETEKDMNLKLDLENAISLLKPIERAAVTMCFCQELTHQDVATILDVPLGTLKTHVNRGRQKLKKSLLQAEVM